MAQTLEKILLQKIRDMPAEEVEVAQAPKSKGKKGRAQKPVGATITRKRTIDSQPVQSVNTVTSSNDEVAMPPSGYDTELTATSLSQPDQNGSVPPAENIVSGAPVAQITNSLIQVCD